jgi:hypothetical protein
MTPDNPPDTPGGMFTVHLMYAGHGLNVCRTWFECMLGMV